jgi:hypothetical protein
MTTRSHPDLEGVLCALGPDARVQLETLTEPAFRKATEAGMPFPFRGTILKRTRLRAVLNADYGAAVNARRGAEGKAADFVPGPRKWGVKVEGTPLIRHKDQLYLEYQVAEVLAVRYELDGRPIEAASLEPWLPARSQGASQGLDDQVVIRTLKLDNLVDVHLDLDFHPAA